MLKRWQVVAAVILGALVGGVLLFMQVLGLVLVWFSYFDPTALGVLLSHDAAWNLIKDVATNGRIIKQVLIGFVLGGATAYMWTQREQRRKQATLAGFICGGLLSVILLPQHVVEAWGDWHTYTNTMTIVAAIISDLFELALTWAIVLIWWGYRLSNPKRK